MTDARGAERARDLGPLCSGSKCEALAKSTAAGVDAELATGFRIDQPEQTDVRKLLLTRIANLDCDDVVPTRHLEEWSPPVTRASEVRDHYDERLLTRERAGASKCATE